MKKRTFKTICIDQAIAIVLFLVVPAVVTLLVPRTTTELRRVGEQASAKITKHILLIVPIRALTIEPVVKVEFQVTASKYGYSTHSDRRRNRKVNSAGDGSIWIIGSASRYRIQSNPTDAPVQAAQVQAFLDDPAATPFTMTSTAGWALTYLLGGIVSALSGLYCLGATLAIGRWLLSAVLPRHDSLASNKTQSFDAASSTKRHDP